MYFIIANQEFCTPNTMQSHLLKTAPCLEKKKDYNVNNLDFYWVQSSWPAMVTGSHCICHLTFVCYVNREAICVMVNLCLGTENTLIK